MSYPNPFYRKVPRPTVMTAGAASQQAGLAEYARRNQAILDETLGSRNLYPQAMQNIQGSVANRGMEQIAGQVAANPTPMNDALKNKIIGAQSDRAVHGYNQGRQQLNAALARAGALDSAAGAGKQIGMSNQLTGQLQGVQRQADIDQAGMNFTGRLQSLGALQGVQGQQANQQFMGAAGQVNTMAALPVPKPTQAELRMPSQAWGQMGGQQPNVVQLNPIQRHYQRQKAAAGY